MHLAAILSAMGEKQPELAEKVNVYGFLNGLNLAREHKCTMFSPSSIASYGGEHFPKDNTPEDTILQPTTIYGVTKVFNEMIGDYYNKKFGVDFRGIKYPGVISSEKYAFNGTACYSTRRFILPSLKHIEIFFDALEKGHYTSFLGPKSYLPMIYIDDCIAGTVSVLVCV